MITGPVISGGVVVPPPVTSYANSGGTGNRTALITVTTSIVPSSGAGTQENLVDGNTATGGCSWGGGAPSITFDFGVGVKKYITEFTKRTVSNPAGTWKWQVSDDNSSYTDISSAVLSSGAVEVNSMLPPASVGYRYYRQVCTTSVGATFIQEIEFKIADGA